MNTEQPLESVLWDRGAKHISFPSAQPSFSEAWVVWELEVNRRALLWWPGGAGGGTKWRA